MFSRGHMEYTLTFADKQIKNGRNPSIYAGLWPYHFVIFSWCFFYFFVFAKIFFISPRVRIRFPKSISIINPISFSTSS